MNIKLNGSVFFGGEEIYFEDFEVAVDEDLPVYQFEEDDDIDEDDYTEDCDLECDGNCYDCEYGDEDDEDDDEDDSLNPLEKLIEEYAEFLVDENLCIDCAKNVLENFVYELIIIKD